MRVATAVRTIVNTQQALRADPTRAGEVEKRRFPPDTVELIATLVERDLPSMTLLFLMRRWLGSIGSLNPLVYFLAQYPTSRRRLFASAIFGVPEI